MERLTVLNLKGNMKLNKVTDYTRYVNIVNEFKQVGTISNDYLQAEVSNLIAQELLYEYCTTKNAFLFVEKEGFFRMYYYLNDLSQITCFDDVELVIEILFRGDVSSVNSEITYFEKCGFKKNLIRDQYAGRYSDFVNPVKPKGVVIQEASTLDEVQWACELFNSSFDKWSGDYISINKYPILLNNGDILLAKDLHGNLLGATQRELKKGIVNWAHLAVISSARGMGIGTLLMDAFIERNHVDDRTRYMMWVQRQNSTAIRMYQHKGFKYIGKSTISMVKLKKL